MHPSRIWQLVYLSSVIFIVRNTDSYCLKMNYVQQRANLKQNTPMTKLLAPEPVDLLALLPQAQIVASRGSWQPGQPSPNLSWPYYRCLLRVDRVETAFGTATKRSMCQEIRLAVPPFFKKWVVSHAVTMPLWPHAAQFIAPYGPTPTHQKLPAFCRFNFQND